MITSPEAIAWGAMSELERGQVVEAMRRNGYYPEGGGADLTSDTPPLFISGDGRVVNINGVEPFEVDRPATRLPQLGALGALIVAGLLFMFIN